MDTQEKVRHICDILKTLGEPGSAKQIADILAMCPSTITRYMNGEIEARGSAKDAIDTFYRVLVNSTDGNQEAKKILEAALGQHGLLRMGIGGALIALGMTWLIRNPRSVLNEPETLHREDREPTRTRTSSKRARKA